MTSLFGTIQGIGGGKVYPPKWHEIGYSSTPTEILDAFDYAKLIQANFTTGTKYTSDKKLFFFPAVDISEYLSLNGMFKDSNLMHTDELTVGQTTPTGNVNCQEMFRSSLVGNVKIKGKTSTQKLSVANMFLGCKVLKEATLNDCKLIDTQSMFNACSNLEDVIGNFDTSESTNFSQMFEDCSSLVAMPQMNTSSATNMYRAFHNCTSLQTMEVLITNSVTNFQQMFWNCSALKTLPLIPFTSATNLTNMFQGTGSNLTEQSRDNILHSLTSATAYTGTKTLAQLGFTSSMYSASSWQALSYYSAFVNAGWSIGYS